MDSGAAVESQEAAMPAAVALDFTDGEVYPSTSRIPRRIQRRFRHSRSGGRTSMEDIEAKLRDAEIRRKVFIFVRFLLVIYVSFIYVRILVTVGLLWFLVFLVHMAKQSATPYQFHDWLSTKARPKPRSPSWSSQDENPGQRLEAKLVAAEQKRLSLLAKAQMRLARLDELRQAAKSDVKMRFEKEREELGTRVESRVQQAEENRRRLLKAHSQRKAAIRERIARSVSQRIIGENRYKECVRSAIFQKRAAAEKKRMGLLEAEKRRAHARVVQARKVAKIVHHRRETERKRMKEQLENKLQKLAARRQRAEYLKQRGSPHSSARVNLTRHGEFLSKKLARCWRRFVRSRRTTLALVKAYDALKLNEKSISVMPFEQVALLIESSTTLQTAKALLDRLESRFSLLLSSGPSSIENIDHLLKRLASPNRKIPSSRVSKQRGAARRESVKGPKSERNMSRYPVRVVLCAYMILGHPNAVFSGQGEREVVLRQSAINFIREFELLVNIILYGPNSAHSLTPSAPVTMSLEHLEETSSNLPTEQNFRCQLRSFDSAWCSYLYRFVVWKAKDARSLEEDLIRAACQMELSMMQTCRMTAAGKTSDLSHDMMAIQRQVIEDQKLIREKVLHLSGNAGLERMESSLSDMRTKFFEAKENGSPLANPVVHISSPLVSDPAIQLDSVPNNQNVEASRRSNNVVRSLFGVSSSAQPKIGSEDPHTDVQSSSVRGMHVPTENVLLVNEIMHWNLKQLSGDFDMVKAEELSIKVKETMEKAFWDEILDSLQGVKPDYSRLISLLKEVRDELCDLAPQKWKADILNSIDLDILSQVLEPGAPDTDYLGNILEYVLAMLQKLSAPANEDSMKKDHQILLNRLAGIAESNDKQSKSFIVAAVEGLRFILEQIQTLKKEVSFARIKLLEPIIKGSGGLEYLQNAFTDRFGSPNADSNTIPLTRQWLYSTSNSSTEEWTEHIDVCTALSASHGLPTAALRTGGAGFAALTRQDDSLTNSGDDELLPECSGEKVDKLLRLGLVKLASVVEGVTMERVPETLNLNVSRLRSVQSQFQQIIVTATSILVLRQFLLTEGSVTLAELESIISNTGRELSEFLKTSSDVSIQTITEMLMSACSSRNHESSKEMVARMLTKSLQNGDTVFEKVSKSVYLALRGVVLGGNGEVGRKLADVALRRIGAAALVDQIVGTGSILIMMAIVTNRVHGPWYRVMV
ncbi:hypothetical protein ZIOFF_024291 [Zingiber officinale]|uniref:T-complex protein 11 n=1 Tax=Zingiber officinale TaxID=94328 RepID=A0A8J5H847_ZINOF|nr:hypothetical protein ZIOFF_024291 [Zingiber officinale]